MQRNTGLSKRALHEWDAVPQLSSAALHSSSSTGRGGSCPPPRRPEGASICTGEGPSKMRNSRAPSLGRHSLTMAARLRKIAIVISCFQRFRSPDLASAPIRRLALSAATYSDRTTAGCGTPSLVQIIGRKAIPACRSSSRMRAYLRNFPRNAAVLASSPAAQFSGLVTITSRAADRPGRAAVVRISAGRNDVKVRPGASVVRLGSANRRPSAKAWTTA